MVRGLVSRLWAGVCKAKTAEFQPKVTKRTADSASDVSVFEDSTTLLRVQERRLFISFDNGVNWEKSEELPVDIWMVEIDENYRNSRAVATGYGESHMTEDQGKHWRKLNLPDFEGNYGLDTHPFEKDYLLASCTAYYPVDEACQEDSDDFGNIGEENSYVSNDGGKNFRKLDYIVREFGCKSRNSISASNKDLIYCFDGAGHVFYTDDFGKSINPIDQFKDHTVSALRILDSHVLVFTLEDEFDRWSSPTNLWVSNDGFSFDKASLPTVLRRSSIGRIIEDELGRIIIPTNTSLSEEQASPIFISDSSGLQFRLLDIGTEGTLDSSSFKTSKTLKGAIWASLTLKHPDRRGYSSHSKISFDYGNTWSNLRVIRSPDQPEDLFRCDVDDVENCSLKPFPFVYETNDGEHPDNQTAGTLMTVGNVGEDANFPEETMTFISRDSGRTWEVAFKYPCRYAFGDGGNIILAMALSPRYNGRPGEFYYSLDQGKTWKEYQLEVAIRPSQIICTTSDGSCLNFIIGGYSLDQKLLYTIDFTDAFNGQSCSSKDLER